jgi:hypothetical protein
MERRPWARLALVTLSLIAVLHSRALAQQAPPTVRGLLSGFGSVSYAGLTQGPFQNDFRAIFAPLLLYQVGDDLLFEGELDIELEEGQTEVHLEHAQLHYLGFERLQLTAGMLHLPFGTWHHSSWVNRLPTPPLLWEDSHGAPASEGLLPILFDVGAMATVTVPIGTWSGSAAVWVSQGPSDEVGAHSHGGTGQPQRPDTDVPNLGYGANFEDNNSDKMVGVRLRAVSGTGLFLHVAGYRSAYDDDGDLGVSGLNVSVMWMPGPMSRPHFRLHAEGILLEQEYVTASSSEDSARYGGYYVEISRRWGEAEPVARWSHLLSERVGGDRVLPRRRQTQVGVNYWMTPSSPVKVAYSLEPDGADYFSIEWTVGF